MIDIASTAIKDYVVNWHEVSRDTRQPSQWTLSLTHSLGLNHPYTNGAFVCLLVCQLPEGKIILSQMHWN